MRMQAKHGIRLRAASLALLAALVVVVTGSSCGSNRGAVPQGSSFDAVGWTKDGRVVAATSRIDDSARLWWIRADQKWQPLPFTYCSLAGVLSTFPVPAADEIGLTLWCEQAPQYRVVSLDVDTGVVKLFAESHSIHAAAWSSISSTTYAEYGENGCYGVGVVSGGGIETIGFTVNVAGAAVALGSGLPKPGGVCSPTILARRPTLSTDGRYLAFAVRFCDGICRGLVEASADWRILVHDLTTAQTKLLEPTFNLPYAMVLSESGVVVSGKRDNNEGIWFCALSTECVEPRRISKARGLTLALNADGNRIVMGDPQGHSVNYIPLTN